MRGDNAGEKRADSERGNGSGKDHRIPALNVIKLSGDQTGASDRGRNADEKPDEDLQECSPQNQSNHIASVCAQGHPHANFAGAALDGIGSDAIQSNRSQNECEDAEESGHVRDGALLIESVGNLFLHGPDVQDGQVRIYFSENTADLRLQPVHGAA